MIYFDHNAMPPLRPLARQAWLGAGEKFIGNPSSSACVGGKAAPLPVLAAMSYSPSEAGRVLRFSSDWEIT
jgi:cysteine sulfinate desulfinase/cysteine desulfurase-like protein